MLHHPDLPAVCMKCGSHDTITRESRMFHWRPVWARYLLVCGIGLFVMLITTQSASLEIPLCPACTERWQTARTAQIAGVLAIAVGFAVLDAGEPREQAHRSRGVPRHRRRLRRDDLHVVRKRMLRASAIDEDEIGLLGVHPTAVDETLVSARPPLPPPTSAS